MLLLLEGQVVHLAAPKTHFMHDIELSADTPVFATAKEEMSPTRGGSLDCIETEMVRVRWKVYTFSYQIEKDDQVELPPCGKCFAELVLKSDV